MSNMQYTAVMDIHDWDSIQIEEEILSAVGCRIIPLEFSNDEELLAAIKDVDAILPRYVNIQRHHIQAMTRCKIIARSGIGVDIVDVKAATEMGIWVTNVPRYCEEEVADHALALILACVRKLNHYQRSVQQGIWKWQAGKPIKRLSESTFGLIGFGKIGRLVWKRMRGFGCRGLIYDPYLPAKVIAEAGAQKSDLDFLLQQADIIHVQSPLTPETHHMIGAREIALLKPNAIITNTARGPIIDERALYQGLVSGKIAAAGGTCQSARLETRQPTDIPAQCDCHPTYCLVLRASR